MIPLGLRARFALLAGALVVVVASLMGAGGYLALRAALLAREAREALDQAEQLAALVDVPGRHATSGQANQVDLTDGSLTDGFTRGGLRAAITRGDGRLVQASPGAISPPAGMRERCLRAGTAARRRPWPAPVSGRRPGRWAQSPSQRRSRRPTGRSRGSPGRWRWGSRRARSWQPRWRA
jgi:hypothetical protein